MKKNIESQITGRLFIDPYENGILEKCKEKIEYSDSNASWKLWHGVTEEFEDTFFFAELRIKNTHLIPKIFDRNPKYTSNENWFLLKDQEDTFDIYEKNRFFLGGIAEATQLGIPFKEEFQGFCFHRQAPYEEFLNSTHKLLMAFNDRLKEEIQ
ncbi:hypothetical protein LEP1GSC060_3466 [Leptospira weilii serovar Ranarum str. ICFT]|uniref:Uncharacterized protein n=1 Tax=Leptospira weilii serovar Ranarum str. ICFT TaxID=1218598 RepID=N1WDP0_9LEPT|nr:hypothetical protein [Leptospira weilii]EMY77050.1 hypothetical protein LEP1GSC060_3466 [Leptospira weilii serovar Ranarum str. ICFT]